MASKKRLRKHKQYAMNRRRMSGKKPMSKETKKARKEKSIIDRARTLKDVEGKKKGNKGFSKI